MADTISGPVTKIIDGDTFEMNVTHIGKKNDYEYNDTERVRTSNFSKPEKDTETGKKATQSLINKLSGKEVMVHVDARDTFGRVLGRVEII